MAISSTFLKILESTIFTRLLDEINDKKILCNKQIGFIKGCGTELNLLIIYFGYLIILINFNLKKMK